MYRLASGDPFLNRAFRFVLRLGSAFCFIVFNLGNFDFVKL